MLFNSFIYTYLNLQNFLYDFNYKLYILFPVKKGNFYIKILVQFPKNINYLLNIHLEFKIFSLADVF
jgi:hypothetical protein